MKFVTIQIFILLIVTIGAMKTNATTPVMIPGSPTCATIGLSTAVRNDYVMTANYHYNISGIGNLSVKVWQRGQFSYESNPSFVRAVILKGGPNSNVYYYPGGGNFDYQITTPIDGNGELYSIAYYEVCYAQVTTSAEVSISGKIMSQTGVGIRAATVILTDQKGNSQSKRSNEFGQYKFDDVAVGQIYTVTVKAKGYSFNTVTVQLQEELTDLNIICQ